MDKNVAADIEKLFHDTTKSRHIHEAVLHIENSKGDIQHTLGYNDRDIDTKLLIASITKLLPTMVLSILQDRGKLHFTDSIHRYLNADILNKLHVYKGTDYSRQLTIEHLLFQSSGLPDYYEEGGTGSIKHSMIKEDAAHSFESLLAITKRMPPHFPPGNKRRAYYSDINFDLLGKIIEAVTAKQLDQVYQELLFAPLGLRNTYVVNGEEGSAPGIYHKDKLLYRPKALESWPASGAVISSARELTTILKVFFHGDLYAEKGFKHLQRYRKLPIAMGPIRYGGGHMQIRLGGLATLFRGNGQLVGHSGSTGSFAFYYPETDLFFVGDLNQMAKPALPIRFVMKLALKCAKVLDKKAKLGIQ